jgi:hypothetical protein
MPNGWNPPFEQQFNVVEAPEFIYPGNQEVLKRLENYNSLMFAARFSICCIFDQFGYDIEFDLESAKNVTHTISVA